MIECKCSDSSAEIAAICSSVAGTVNPYDSPIFQEQLSQQVKGLCLYGF